MQEHPTLRTVSFNGFGQASEADASALEVLKDPDEVITRYNRTQTTNGTFSDARRPHQTAEPSTSTNAPSPSHQDEASPGARACPMHDKADEKHQDNRRTRSMHHARSRSSQRQEGACNGWSYERRAPRRSCQPPGKGSNEANGEQGAEAPAETAKDEGEDRHRARKNAQTVCADGLLNCTCDKCNMHK